MSLSFEDRDRESVLRDLIASDEEVRRLAVQRVSELPVDESVPRLVECLGDGSWRVRKAAVERLAACGHTSAIDALIAALADGENPGRRNSAVEALVERGSECVPRLIEALRSDDVDVRKFAVDTLAGIEDVSARSAMMDTLRDPDPNVRAAAADALGVLGGADAPALLLTLSNRGDEDVLVRFSALGSLARLETQVSAGDLAVALDEATLRSAALRVLGRVDDQESRAQLLKSIASGSRPAREAAMGALLRLLSNVDGAGSERLVMEIRTAVASVPTLVDDAIERLQEADLGTQLLLIQFLGVLGVPVVVLPILAVARDEALREVARGTLSGMGAVASAEIDARWTELDADRRCDACLLLEQTGGATAIRRLRIALEESEASVRAAAARALASLGCADALPGLVRRLEIAADGDDFEAEDELEAIIDSLITLAGQGSCEAGEAIELLSARLDGATEPVRMSIARVLGRIGRPQDGVLVGFLLKDPSAGVRRAGVEALVHLEPGSASEPLRLALADEAASVRMAAASALGSSRNPGVIDLLRRLIHDDDDRVRAAALRGIGAHGARAETAAEWDAIAPLLETALWDQGAVALAAADALVLIGGPKAARLALTLVDRPEAELVQSAVSCIGTHGDADCVEELLRLVTHPSWVVRAETIQVLAERRVDKAVPPILRCLETEQDDFVRTAILAALKRLEG